MSQYSFLYFTQKTPYKIDTGWFLRMQAQLYALSRLGRIVFIGERRWKEELDASDKDRMAFEFLSTYCQEIHLFNPVDYPNTATGIFDRVRRNGLKMSSLIANPAAVQLLQEHSSAVNVVWLDSIFSAQYILRLQAEKIKTILDMLNADSDLAWQEFRSLPLGMAKLRSLIRWVNVIQTERTYLPKFDRICTVSEEDERYYRKWLPAGKLVVIPNSVQLQDARSVRTVDEHTIVFSGILSYFPNQNGIRWFISDIFPLIKQTIPDVRLFIVGNAPPQDIQMMGSDQITITGKVPDVLPYLQQATVSICPLLEGSGSRLKILESMAAGVPVVSTSKGAEGIRAENDRHLLISDRPDEFARCVIDLLCNPDTRMKLSQNALQLVRESYSWDSNVERIARMITDLFNPTFF